MEVHRVLVPPLKTDLALTEIVPDGRFGGLGPSALFHAEKEPSQDLEIVQI